MTTPDHAGDDMRCLFCGTRREGTCRMVIAPDTGAVICDLCIIQCWDLLAKESDQVIQRPVRPGIDLDYPATP